MELLHFPFSAALNPTVPELQGHSVMSSALDLSDVGPISPSTTDESGYRTRCASISQSINGETSQLDCCSRFFPEHGTFLLDELEEDDDVFAGSSSDAPESMMGDREFSDIMPIRSRAFSYPFTLTDVGFPLSSSALALRRQFFLKPTLLAAGGHGEESDEGHDDDEIDIDGVDGVHGPSSPASEDDDGSSDNDTIRESYCGSPDLEEERYLDLPDLVRSGLHRRQETTQSRLARSTDMEFRIACRLAKIGDEFDLKYFNSNDTTDGGALSLFSMETVTRMWSFFAVNTLTSCPSPKETPRHRSHSTAD